MFAIYIFAKLIEWFFITLAFLTVLLIEGLARLFGSTAYAVRSSGALDAGSTQDTAPLSTEHVDDMNSMSNDELRDYIKAARL